MEEDTLHWYIYDLERIIFECVRLADIMRMGDSQRLEKIYHAINKRFDDALLNDPPPAPPPTDENEATP